MKSCPTQFGQKGKEMEGCRGWKGLLVCLYPEGSRILCLKS